MKIIKTLTAILLVAVLALSMSAAVFADGAEAPAAASSQADSENTVRDYKAIAAALLMGAAAAAGAIGMAMTIMKTIDGIARQPEAASNIRSAMMLGLVFIETAIIYALIVAILVVFVL